MDSKVLNGHEKQLRDQILKDLDTNFLVEAGAGAGKSTLIIERIIHQVLNGTSLKSIAAITFTKNSGKELEEKLNGKLATMFKKYSKEAYPDEYSRLEEAVEDLETMSIGTIDGFCRSILKEHPFETGALAMGFQLIEEEEEKKLVKRIYEIHSKDFQKDPLYKELEKEIQHAGSTLTVESYFGIESVYEEACNKEHTPIEIPSGKKCVIATKDFFQQEKDFWDAFLRSFQDLRIGDGTVKREITEKDFQGSLKSNRLTKALQVFLFQEQISLEDPDYKLLTKETLELLNKEALSEISLEGIVKKKPVFTVPVVNFEPLVKMHEEKTRYYYGICTELVIILREKYVQYKRDHNLVTFDDLLYFTKELLLKDEKIRARYHERYKTIYVDEFQDTNPLQTEILFLLMDQNLQNKCWRNGVLKDGALFLVGDPKQSIYRFRSADITLYNELKARFLNSAGNEKMASLRWNFRSDEKVVAYINERFMGKDTKDTKGNLLLTEVPFYYEWQVPHQTVFKGMDAEGLLNEMRDQEEDSENSLFKGIYKLSSGSGDKLKVEDLMKLDCLNVATLIRSMVEGQVQIKVYEQGEVLVRPVTYKDFMVVTLRTKNMEHYIQAMDEQGIPSSLSGKKFYYEQKESVNLIELIGFLANPKDARALAGILVNLYGYSLPELHESLKLKHLSWYNLRKCMETVQVEEGVKQALKQLEELIAYSRTCVDPRQILGHCVEQLQAIYCSHYSAISFQNAMKTLVNLVEKVKGEDITNLYDLHQCLLRKYIQLPVRREVNLQEEDVVRIMNLHQVKGLESNIVILALNQSDRKPGNRTSLTFGALEKEELLLKFGSSQRHVCAHEKWGEAQKKEVLLEKSELHRLYYVAATRAINGLIISTDEYNDIWKTICSYKDPVPDVFDTLENWKIPIQREMPKVLEVHLQEIGQKDFTLLTDAMGSLKSRCTIELIPSDLEREVYRPLLGEDTEASLEEVVDTAEEAALMEDHPYGPHYGTLIHSAFERVIDHIRNTGNLSLEDPLHEAIGEFYREVYLQKPSFEKLFYTKKFSQEGETPSHEVRPLAEIISLLTPELEDACLALLQSPFKDTTFMEVLKKAKEVYTELPFSVLIKTDSKNLLDLEILDTLRNTLMKNEVTLQVEEDQKSIYISGIMDLVILDDKGITLVDYKTNRSSETASEFIRKMLGTYHGQLNLYRLVLKKVYEGIIEDVQALLYLKGIKSFVKVNNILSQIK